MSLIDVKVPDIGEFQDVEVIEVICKVGETVAVEEPLISMESDKATMDVPSPVAGEICEIKVKAGDKVSEGSLILKLKAVENKDLESQKLSATRQSQDSGRAPQSSILKSFTFSNVSSVKCVYSLKPHSKQVISTSPSTSPVVVGGFSSYIIVLLPHRTHILSFLPLKRSTPIS